MERGPVQTDLAKHCSHVLYGCTYLLNYHIIHSDKGYSKSKLSVCLY